MKSLQDYLEERYRIKTVSSYLKNIHQYILLVGEARAKTATYQDMIDYIGKLREKYASIHSVVNKLGSIKSYYAWLVHTKQRKDHPCKNIYLKDAAARPFQHQDLFTAAELELMEKSVWCREGKGIFMNRIIISLLTHQAATAMELARLRMKDINLEEAEISLKYGENIQPRTLPLLPKQIMLINNYLIKERCLFLEKNKDVKTKQEAEIFFLIDTAGSSMIQENIYYAVKKLRKFFPSKYVSTQTIRQSVIVNLLKAGKNLRAVQAFAGHKHVISTEKYKQQSIEELKAEIDKYHPLNQRTS
jgi:site-specific recombinase XerD